MNSKYLRYLLLQYNLLKKNIHTTCAATLIETTTHAQIVL